MDDERLALMGVHLVHPGMHLVLTDLRGRIIDHHTPDQLGALTHELVLGEVSAYVRAISERFPAHQLLGVGVATPGFIEPSTGAVIAIGRVPDWSNFPLRERVAAVAEAETLVVNDVDALAAAEFDELRDERTYAYAGVSEGIKISLFLNGRPYLGPFGNAGLVNLNTLASLGQQSGEVLTTQGLSEAYLRMAPAEHPVAVALRAERNPHRRFERVLQAYADPDDAVAQPLVSELSRLLAAQLALFVYLIQPSLLVIGGAVAAAPDTLFFATETALRSHLPSLLNNNLVVRKAQLASPLTGAVGATRVLMKSILNGEGPLPTATAGGSMALSGGASRRA
jgi:predicted NBD/HSP70 family sugar kinase